VSVRPVIGQDVHDQRIGARSSTVRSSTGRSSTVRSSTVRSSTVRSYSLALGFAALILVGGLPLRAAAPVKVTFWHYVSAPQPSKELEAQVAAFNASQNKYQIEALAVGTYQDVNIKLVAALRANNAPSMAMVDNVFFTRLAAGNQLATLNAVLELPAAVQADLVPVAWNYGQINGQRLGLPWATSSLLLFYNSEALKGKGVSPPKTWAEFALAAKKLTARGSKGAVFVVDAWAFGSLVTGLGGNIFDAKGIPDFDGPASLEGVRFLLDLQKAGALSVRSYSEAEAGIIDFLRTKTFFAIAPSDVYASLKQYSTAFNLGAVTLPGRSIAGEAQLVAFNGSSLDEQRGVGEFWKFLIKPENQERWAKASYYLPVRKSVTVKPDERGLIAEGRVGLERAFNFPQRGEMQEWRRIIEDALERILKGGVDPVVALGEAQKKTNAVGK
jgi:sn-glycerol 3-phosphate transport system substrate-binding protein